ncbi:TetR/AcrR family transcriptional regulator [Nocardia sp. NPDC050193]
MPEMVMPGASTRRRGERLRRDILDAAWEVLAETGYAKLTIEAVAARARTSRPVIYRRWSTRADLVLAAITQASPLLAEAPDTGHLRSDVFALLTRISQYCCPVRGEAIAGLITETARDPVASAALRTQIANAAPDDHLRIIVERAANRHETSRITIPDRVARLPFDLIRNEVVLEGRPPTEKTIAEITDSVVLPVLRYLGGAH